MAKVTLQCKSPGCTQTITVQEGSAGESLNMAPRWRMVEVNASESNGFDDKEPRWFGRAFVPVCSHTCGVILKGEINDNARVHSRFKAELLGWIRRYSELDIIATNGTDSITSMLATNGSDNAWLAIDALIHVVNAPGALSVCVRDDKQYRLRPVDDARRVILGRAARLNDGSFVYKVRCSKCEALGELERSKKFPLVLKGCKCSTEPVLESEG